MLSEFIEVVILYLPRVAFATIALVLGWAIGHLVGFLLNRIVGKVGWESAFRRTSVGRAILRSGYTPSGFFAALGKGIVYLFAIISALDLLSVPLLTTAVQAFLEYLPNLVGGAMILIIGLIFADWVGECIKKGSFLTVQSSLIGELTRIILYFIVLTLALTQMKIDVTILYVFAQALAWGSAIALSIAFGWYLKDKVGPWLDTMLARESKKAEDT